MSGRRKIKISLNSPLPLNELSAASASPFAAFQDIISPSGSLNFEGKASVDSTGIHFENGTHYSISLDHIKVIKLLGKGQYGVVQLVEHQPTGIYMGIPI